MDLDQKPQVELTREELYRLVWEAPMSRLAAEYGISGNGLAKICDRLKVPYPPRGYWAKKAAGHKVAKNRLPTNADAPQSATITPTPARLARVPKATRQTSVDDARSEVTPIHVACRLSRPHPIIAGWMAEHERKKLEAQRERDPWRKKFIDPGEYTVVDRRRHRILDAILKELDRLGVRAVEGQHKELFIKFQHEQIEIQLREKQKQVRHRLGENESSWITNPEKRWRVDLEPTGKLVFAVKTYLPSGLRREWLESEKAPLESLLPEIVATLMAAGPLLADQRQRREEERRLEQIAEQKRYEAAEKRKVEENQRRRFVDLAYGWRDTKIAREFLGALRTSEPNLNKDIAGASLITWMSRIERFLADDDPLERGAEAVFADIAEVTSWTYRE